MSSWRGRFHPNNLVFWQAVYYMQYHKKMVYNRANISYASLYPPLFIGPLLAFSRAGNSAFMLVLHELHQHWVAVNKAFAFLPMHRPQNSPSLLAPTTPGPDCLQSKVIITANCALCETLLLLVCRLGLVLLFSTFLYLYLYICISAFPLLTPPFLPAIPSYLCTLLGEIAWNLY